ENHDMTAVALVSCGVATGWGSSVHRADVGAGDTVVVVGVGGIGSAAIQGARMAGAARVVAIDPLENKRELAMDFGATHTAASMEDAAADVMEMTAGQMADKLVLCPGVVHGDMLAPAMSLVRKGGTVVVTGISPIGEIDAKMSLFELAMFNKEVKGSIFGSGNPRADIPYLLDLYGQGQLKLDEMVTKTYSLDQINDGYQDMRDGKNIRGVIVFD
ncbi:MAG: zinc-binding dehydrogenase, partial [Acidimicrobiia bacterium]|nr:zinc-binding dehydrogenase [Acidimicrobiia bacterium]